MSDHAASPTFHYRPLIDVELRHQYFADERCRGVGVRVDDESRRIMDGAGLLLRSGPSGFTVFHDQLKTEVLRQLVAASPATLRLVVFTTDPLVAAYTDPNPYSDESVLFFTDAAGSAGGDVNRLAADTVVTDEAFLPDDRPEPIVHLAPPPPVGDEQQPPEPRTTASIMASLLQDPRQRPRPLCVIHLEITSPMLPAEQAETEEPGGDNAPVKLPAPKRYSLTFRNRETFWTYHLLGDLSKVEKIEIEAANPTATFTKQEPQENGSAGAGLTFRSDIALPLLEKPTTEVSETRTMPSPIGERRRRLPNASVEHLGYGLQSAGRVAVSDIFVSS